MKALSTGWETGLDLAFFESSHARLLINLVEDPALHHLQLCYLLTFINLVNISSRF